MKLSLTVSFLSQIVLVNGKRGGDIITEKRRRSLKKFIKSRSTDNAGDLGQEYTKRQECDPKFTKADLGVLFCERGRYCVPDKNSLLGGFCSTSSKVRALQTCPTTEHDDYSCDCSNYVTGMGGPITDCTFPSYCLPLVGEPNGETEVCFGSTRDAFYNGSGNLESSTSCYNGYKPYTIKGCFTYTYGSDNEKTSCSISIDDVDCTSCSLVTCRGSDDYFNFDCTNTVTGVSGNTCDGEFPLPIIGYADFNATETSTPDGTPMPAMPSATTSPMDTSPGPTTEDATPMPMMPQTSPAPMDTPSPVMASTNMPSKAPSSDSTLAWTSRSIYAASALGAVLSIFVYN